MASRMEQWEETLQREGKVEMTLPVGKKIFSGLVGLFLLVAGVLLILLTPAAGEEAAQWYVVIPVVAVFLLLGAWLIFAQLFGRYNVIVTKQDIGYPKVRVPWSEVDGVGETLQNIRHGGLVSSNHKFVTILLTERGWQQFLDQHGPLGRMTHLANSKITGHQAFYPGKMLEGTADDRQRWITTVHLRAHGYTLSNLEDVGLPGYHQWSPPRSGE